MTKISFMFLKNSSNFHWSGELAEDFSRLAESTLHERKQNSSVILSTYQKFDEKVYETFWEDLGCVS